MTQPELQPTTTPLDSKRQRFNVEFLILACVVIVLAFVLQVQEDGERVAVGGSPDAVLPPTCFSYAWFGVRCPGCGLTRSFIHLAHGDPLSSFRSHRLGWLVFALTLAQIPYRLHLLFRPGKSQALLLFARWVGRVLIVLLFANWLGEQLFWR
jgi:hypothetical protein